jgi:hypothetical protein
LNLIRIRFVVQKPGYPLEKVAQFPREIVVLLREHSVTTAEEFLGLAQSAPTALASLLRTDQDGLRAFEKAAAEVVPAEELEQIAREAKKDSTRYGLGHDAPPAGKSTF